MKLRVLALDYDGTIAEDGTLHPDARGAIEAVRRQGIVVVLVTGRILSDLRTKLGDLRLFDAVVAENGALAALPQTGSSAVFAPPCSRAFLDSLRGRGIDARAGECLVELDASAAPAVLDVVREMQLPLALHFNRGRLMVLPQAVSKATGLKETLRMMRLSFHNAIAVGDAENDHELLAACEIGAAVAWGSAALRSAADLVIDGTGPPAVAQFIRSAAASARITPGARRRLLLGRDAQGADVSLPLRGRNFLVAGDPRSGKSWVAGLLSEELVLQGYSLCILDPEGDYVALERLPGCVLLGGDDPPPSMKELARMLRHADVSVIVDLARSGKAEKRRYVQRALLTLADLRRETGIPHWVVVDEAHYFLRDPAQARVLDNQVAGYTLITYRATSLHPDVLAATESVIVTGETDPAEVKLLHETWHGKEDLSHWQETLASLELDEAAILPGSGDPNGTLRRFRVAPRLTSHVRHRHKYLDVPVSPDLSFRFMFDDGTRGPQVCSLAQFVEVLSRTPVERIQGHVQRGDFSRWIGEVFCDPALAGSVRDLEERHRLTRLGDFNGAVVHAVQQRYGAASPTGGA